MHQWKMKYGILKTFAGTKSDIEYAHLEGSLPGWPRYRETIHGYSISTAFSYVWRVMHASCFLFLELTPEKREGRPWQSPKLGIRSPELSKIKRNSSGGGDDEGKAIDAHPLKCCLLVQIWCLLFRLWGFHFEFI